LSEVAVVVEDATVRLAREALLAGVADHLGPADATSMLGVHVDVLLACAHARGVVLQGIGGAFSYPVAAGAHARGIALALAFTLAVLPLALALTGLAGHLHHHVGLALADLPFDEQRRLALAIFAVLAIFALLSLLALGGIRELAELLLSPLGRLVLLARTPDE